MVLLQEPDNNLVEIGNVPVEEGDTPVADILAEDILAVDILVFADNRGWSSDERKCI